MDESARLEVRRRLAERGWGGVTIAQTHGVAAFGQGLPATHEALAALDYAWASVGGEAVLEVAVTAAVMALEG